MEIQNFKEYLKEQRDNNTENTLNELKIGFVGNEYLLLIKKYLGSSKMESLYSKTKMVVVFDEVSLIFNKEGYLVGFETADGEYEVSKNLKSIKDLKGIKSDKLSKFLGRKLKKGGLSKDEVVVYTYFPKDNTELNILINKLIKERGNHANLNDIDTSKITNMETLFDGYLFNGNISQWDVSNVTNMSHMFAESNFNGDISKWDVSKVRYMTTMFTNSKFNGNLSKWKLNDIEPMTLKDMFKGSPLEGKEPTWYNQYDFEDDFEDETP